MIRTQVGTFELVEEFRNGWNPDAFKERYSDILDKYDYIVGDWGYGQLRLRGFYENSNRRVPFEQRIAALDEYLHEFCNFGCAYFVLRRVKSPVETTVTPAAHGPAESAAGPEPQTAWRAHQAEAGQRRGRQHEREERAQRPSRHAPHPRPDRERGDGYSRRERPPRSDKPGNPRTESKGHHRNDRGRRFDRDKDHVHASGRQGREKVPQRTETTDDSNRT